MDIKATYEIWLSDHYTHYGRGIAHLEDGRDLPLKVWVHVASYGRDSVLLDDEESYTYGRFPFRWFTAPGVMEIYNWDALVPRVLLHNESGADIRIDGICVLKSGESKELMRDV